MRAGDPSAGLVFAAMVALWGMLVHGTASGQNTDRLAAFRAKALSIHNAKRALHGVPPLALAPNTDVLNTGAQTWALHLAQTGKFQHSSSADRVGAGENLFVAYDTRTLDSTTVAQNMVNAWYGEVANFDYSQPEAHLHQTGHFTQVVWRTTTTLGCGLAVGSFTDPTTKTVFNSYFGVCRYTPAGNVIGSFAANVPRSQH